MKNKCLKVMTFNLKTDHLFSKKNTWKRRGGAAYSILNKYKCDIIGTQEVSGSIYEDIISRLKGYKIIGKPRTRKIMSERNSILVSEKFNIMNEETFWLSNNPDKEGSSFWYSLFPRICTTAIIMEGNERIARVYNTHLDCLLPIARKKGLEKIIEHMKKYHSEEKLPTILMGDFNAGPNSRLIKGLNERRLDDGKLVAVQEYDKKLYKIGTFRSKKTIHIDYIFVSEDFKINNVQIIKDNYNGIYPSDHYPLMAELQIKEKL